MACPAETPEKELPNQHETRKHATITGLSAAGRTAGTKPPNSCSWMAALISRVMSYGRKRCANTSRCADMAQQTPGDPVNGRTQSNGQTELQNANLPFRNKTVCHLDRVQTQLRRSQQTGMRAFANANAHPGELGTRGPKTCPLPKLDRNNGCTARADNGNADLTEHTDGDVP